MGLFETVSAGKSFFGPGNYLATLVKLEPAEQKNEAWGPQIQWTFHLAPAEERDPEAVIVMEDGETPASFWQFSSTKMTPKAKGRQWAEAFLGRALNDGEDLDPSQIVGKVCLVTLVEEKSETDGKVRAKIAGIQSYDPSKPAARPNVRTRQSAPQSRADDDLPF